MYKIFLKRLLDLFLAFFVLIILLPFYIIITIVLTFLNSGKPFFTQKRVGLNNKIFKLIKFKSMNDKKGKDGVLLKDTERLTPFGKFIRKASLDELPQVFNVIKGDMSFVGPRPLLIEYLPYYNDYHIQRHNVKPGITGLAQVSGRNNLKFSERFNLDVEYVKKQSLFLDIKILWGTFLKVFKSSDIQLGRPMSEVDDIGISKGLSKNYFNPEKKNDK
ncbi:sugar transferase [Tenacibaculum sp. ZS6-P6]|uniref:sugar transferase n=1 Tax=Tenacibaculum sp. ZS6-P6 TaxID=3447503 RepID=UPI003F973E90